MSRTVKGKKVYTCEEMSRRSARREKAWNDAAPKREAKEKAQQAARLAQYKAEQERRKQNVKEHVMVEKARIGLKYRIFASREEAAMIPAMRRELASRADVLPVNPSDPYLLASRPLTMLPAAPSKALPAKGKTRR